MAERARCEDVAALWAAATSAVRDARNGAAFVQRVRDETGVQVDIISGEQEARLTFRGATEGIDITGGAVVCDLGGGSAEIIAARGDEMLWGRSIKVGSGRLTDRHVHHDPPTAAELEEIRRDVAAALETLPSFRATCVIFTGGTASHVAMLLGEEGVSVELSLLELQRVRELLSTEPAAEIVQRFNIRPERAQVLPAGVCALESIVAFYHVEKVVITRHGIREGIIIDHLPKKL
jgi:exopolyphosphatase/guanosine-5'-triphosphate,3'-diphosphate pyrophosphatase